MSAFTKPSLLDKDIRHLEEKINNRISGLYIEINRLNSLNEEQKYAKGMKTTIVIVFCIIAMIIASFSLIVSIIHVWS